jgi:hypothetical protein
MRYDLDVDEVHELARRYVWWKTPTEALAYRAHLLCQIMQLGTYDDVRSARRLFGDDALRDALRSAPPGILDARSWNFWHLNLFGQPAPPLPARPLP